MVTGQRVTAGLRTGPGSSRPPVFRLLLDRYTAAYLDETRVPNTRVVNELDPLRAGSGSAMLTRTVLPLEPGGMS